MGTLLAGAIFMPLDISDPRFISILKDSRPSLILVKDGTQQEIVFGAMKSAHPRLSSVPIHSCPAVNECRDTIPFHSSVCSNHVSHIYYTSGSTGNRLSSGNMIGVE